MTIVYAIQNSIIDKGYVHNKRIPDCIKRGPNLFLSLRIVIALCNTSHSYIM